MRLGDQVTNLELSKKLKALGVPQKSLFYWYADIEMNYHVENITNINCDFVPISAFTSSELGEILPIFYRTGKHLYIKAFVCEHRRQEEQQVQSADTQTNAMAKMLIYLIKNKLLHL